MVLSAQLASALMAVASIPFMVLLGRELCDKRIGWLAAGLFLCMPAWVRLTSDGLTEGTYLFWLALTLWLGARALRDPSVARFLFCGLAAGFGYLTRPEGVELAAAAGAVLLLRQFLPAWRQPWRRAAPQALALAVGTLAVLGPYVLTIGRLTNKNTANVMFGDPKANRYGLPQAAAPGTAPLAVWWFEPDDHDRSRALWAASALATETLQSAHYVVAILGAAGLFWFRPRLRGRPAAWLLAVLIAGHAVVLWRMAVAIGYLSERHTLLFVFAACFPAAAALTRIGRHIAEARAARSLTPGRATAGLLAILLVAALPSLVRPLHGNRAGHRAAGMWLAANSTTADEILDPFNWAHFYSGRLTADPPPTSDRLFVVLEQTDNQHSRLPAIPIAKAKAVHGRIVYHWPEHKPRDQAKVVVYEVSKASLPG
jgi:hypothetical protein